MCGWDLQAPIPFFPCIKPHGSTVSIWWTLTFWTHSLGLLLLLPYHLDHVSGVAFLSSSLQWAWAALRACCSPGHLVFLLLLVLLPCLNEMPTIVISHPFKLQSVLAFPDSQCKVSEESFFPFTTKKCDHLYSCTWYSRALCSSLLHGRESILQGCGLGWVHLVLLATEPLAQARSSDLFLWLMTLEMC